MSCPVMRTAVPSSRMLASARSSAVAHSITRASASSSASRRRLIARSSLGCTVKPSGKVSSAWLSARSRSTGTPVLTRRAVPGTGDYGAVVGEVFFRVERLRRRPEAPASSRLISALASGVGDNAPLDQVRPPTAGAHAGMLVDALVHQRLGEVRLVAFVVTVAPVADQVDHEILAEAPPIGARHPRRRDAGFGIVGVDVDDRHLEAFGEVAGVERAARIARFGREAELIVGDDVDCAARPVAGKLRQVERLGDDPLTGEGGVAVNQDRLGQLRVEDGRAGLADVGSGGARHALDHRIDGFEVAGIGREPHHHFHRHAVDACRGVLPM